MSDPAQELTAIQDALQALTPLDAGARERALAWLAGALGVKIGQPPPGGVSGGGGGGGDGGGHGGGGGRPGDLGTPREFLAAKKPTTDVERVTCLAYYITHARNQPHFKTPELIEINTEAAGSKITNPSQATGNAKDRNGYLAEAGNGNRQITPLGEAVVEAMPDREAVAAVIAASPKKPRRKAAKKKTAK